MHLQLYSYFLSPSAYLLISTLTILPISHSTADIRLNADWENGTLIDYYSQISGNADGVKILDNLTSPIPVCSGNKSIMSKLDYGKGYRSEITVNQKPFNPLEIGKRHWFSFAIFLPNDYAPDYDSTTLWQMHGRPDLEAGEGYRYPPLAIRTIQDQWNLSYINDSRYVSYRPGEVQKPEEKVSKDIGKFETGKWTTFVIDTLWDYRSQGYLKIWKDGELVLNKTNGIGYNDTKGPYVKMGIYKRKWDTSLSWGGPSDVSNRTTYIDDFKIGDASATYDEMLPKCTTELNSLVTTTNILPPSGLSFSVK